MSARPRPVRSNTAANRWAGQAGGSAAPASRSPGASRSCLTNAAGKAGSNCPYSPECPLAKRVKLGFVPSLARRALQDHGYGSSIARSV